VVRYEKKWPGELLHLDRKKLGRIDGVGHRVHGDRRTRKRDIGWEFLHVCIEDATRVACAEMLPDERAETATGLQLRKPTSRHRQHHTAQPTRGPGPNNVLVTNNWTPLPLDRSDLLHHGA
jgi:hypothetical protein